MADIDINHFEEHDTRPEEPMGENIPLTSVLPERGSSWEPDRVKKYHSEEKRVKS